MNQTVVRLILFGAGATLALSQTTSKATGHWQGKILIPEHELNITVDLAQSPKGVWIGSMTVTGSSSRDVPLESIVVEDAAVRFAANLPEHASFAGRLSTDANSLSGTASSDAGDAPFQLARGGEANVKLPPPSSPLSKEFEGEWEGTINTGGGARQVVLKLRPSADGTATAILIAVQKNLEIPVNTVTVKGKDLQLDVRAVSGSYRGTLGPDGAIDGEWSEGGNHTPLTFKRKP